MQINNVLKELNKIISNKKIDFSATTIQLSCIISKTLLASIILIDMKLNKLSRIQAHCGVLYVILDVSNINVSLLLVQCIAIKHI